MDGPGNPWCKQRGYTGEVTLATSYLSSREEARVLFRCKYPSISEGKYDFGLILSERVLVIQLILYIPAMCSLIGDCSREALEQALLARFDFPKGRYDVSRSYCVDLGCLCV